MATINLEDIFSASSKYPTAAGSGWTAFGKALGAIGDTLNQYQKNDDEWLKRDAANYTNFDDLKAAYGENFTPSSAAIADIKAKIEDNQIKADEDTLGKLWNYKLGEADKFNSEAQLFNPKAQAEAKKYFWDLENRDRADTAYAKSQADIAKADFSNEALSSLIQAGNDPTKIEEWKNTYFNAGGLSPDVFKSYNQSNQAVVDTNWYNKAMAVPYSQRADFMSKNPAPSTNMHNMVWGNTQKEIELEEVKKAKIAQQQQAAQMKYQNDLIKQQAKEAKDNELKTLPAKLVNEAGGYDFSANAQMIADNWDSSNIGWWDNSVKDFASTIFGINSDPQRKNLQQAVSNARNMILKLRSGAAVTQGEADRFMQEFPSMNSDEMSLKMGVLNTYKLAADKLNAQANGLYASGYDAKAIKDEADRATEAYNLLINKFYPKAKNEEKNGTKTSVGIGAGARDRTVPKNNSSKIDPDLQKYLQNRQQ